MLAFSRNEKWPLLFPIAILGTISFIAGCTSNSSTPAGGQPPYPVTTAAIVTPTLRELPGQSMVQTGSRENPGGSPGNDPAPIPNNSGSSGGEGEFSVFVNPQKDNLVNAS